MNLRKKFNRPTKQQQISINADIENILTNCESVARKEREELRESQKMHDETCPNCRTKKNSSDHIVNKIRQVQGEGKVGGDFFLGFGSIDGSSSINTHAVNHCNKCGNEWEKFKDKSISRTDIARVCLNYLADVLGNGDNYRWKIEGIKVFDGACAESIYFLMKKEKDYCWMSTESTLKLDLLRKHYKSVYD